MRTVPLSCLPRVKLTLRKPWPHLFLTVNPCIQAWRPEMTANEEVRAEVAALLPAWVPLAEDDGPDPDHWGLEAPETEDDSAASSSDGEDAAAGPQQAVSQADTTREGWGTLMDRTPPPPGAGGAPVAPDAAPAELAIGPSYYPWAAEPPTGGLDPGAHPSSGRHAVVAAPLWPRLCDMDPDLPAALLQAGVFVHLVAEPARVRPSAPKQSQP